MRNGDTSRAASAVSADEPARPTPLRQILAFGGAGIAAAIVHYGTLIGLVQGGALTPVPATLCGYIAGGIVSYALNRRHTYRSDRPHQEAVWRFAAVAAVGFLITFAVMHVLVDRWSLPYLPAQFLTTGIVLIWSFSAHKWWTFGTGHDRGEA
ncbi:Putative flippase GtrA (transmembrane translocase of bactoprenol-linked glucose) [Rhizobiales bacterium GAS191]|jgi:putative flippase GtrA|nr:Putative flippase GtrA (transmembrane translocase of bactoprenol-linked glucose) [Rhizobiales bacterium GAS188]SEC82036.1 Putative flippase GtrA (transmembrane translocase of bactoprenol-linked glucose) [Rhizobiales bacterium GAS191]